MVDLTEIDDRIAKCNKILDDNPNSQIFAALAEAYRKKGEVDQAFRVCQTGLRIHPNYGSAHMVMARINLDKGMNDWAEIEINKVIDIEGNSHATDLLLAEVFINRGDLARATKLLDTLHKNDPGNQHVIKLLDLAKKQGVEVVVETGKPEPPPPAEPTSKKDEPGLKKEIEAKKFSYAELINAISEIGGVEGVLLINKEGLVAESKWIEAQQPDLFGALARDIEKTIQTQMDETRFGKCENILLEGEGLIVNMVPLNDCMIMIKANGQINLGTLRLRMSALISRLDDSLKTAEVQK